MILLLPVLGIVVKLHAITDKTGLSRRTIDRVIAGLKEKGLLIREGAKNNAIWKITGD